MPQNKQTNTYRELNQQGQEVLFPGKEVVEIKIEEFNHLHIKTKAGTLTETYSSLMLLCYWCQF